MNNSIDFQTQMLMDYWNLQPSSVRGTANTTTEYYKRYLYAEIASVFKLNIPWSENWFRFFLFRLGSIAVIYTKEFGWVSGPYSITELDIEYQPKVIEFSNKFLRKPKTGMVGINCEVIRVMDDFFGLDDLVTRTAEMLAQFDKAINVNLMNIGVTKCFEAESKKQADTIKEAYERATQGDPFVVINKEVMNGNSITTLLGSASGEYVVDKLLTDRRACMNNFLTTVGIRNANYSKKERLNSQEVSENNDETRSIVTVIYENIKRSFDRLNEMDSSLNLSIEMRYNYGEGEGDTWLD